MRASPAGIDGLEAALAGSCNMQIRQGNRIRKLRNILAAGMETLVLHSMGGPPLSCEGCVAGVQCGTAEVTPSSRSTATMLAGQRLCVKLAIADMRSRGGNRELNGSTSVRYEKRTRKRSGLHRKMNAL